MKFFISPYFENFKIFRWETPLQFRKNNVFTDGLQFFYLDLENKEIREGDDIILAQIIHFGQRFRGATKGFQGKLTSDGCLIEVSKNKLQTVDVSVVDRNGCSWLFPLEPRKTILLKHGGIFIESDARNFYWNARETNKVKIECDPTDFIFAKVLGVLICFFVYDCLLDDGSHI